MIQGKYEMRVSFLKPSYFIWLLALGLGYASTQIVGLPHLRFSYDFRTTENPYDPFAERYYTRCTYLGPNGQFTIRHPENGTCAVVRLFTPRSVHADG